MFLRVSDQSSTALHLLLHANIAYTILWFILEILLFVFKLFHLPYAAHAFGVEISLVFMVCLNDFIRQYFGIKGNLTLKTSLLIISIVYGLICAIGFAFFLILQSYVQRVEILLSGIGLALILIEILLTIITIIRDSRAMPVLTIEQRIIRFNQVQQRFLNSIKDE